MLISTLRKIITKSYIQPLSHNIKQYFSKQQKEFDIKFDEQQIKKKMQEIKIRKEGGRKQQQKLQFMNTNTNSELARKVRKYRQATQTQNLFHFSDPSIEQKPTILQISGFDDNSIEVDSMIYPPSMIVFKNQLLVWQVPSLQNLKIDDFLILKYIKPKPIYVIVGVNNIQKFPRDIYEYLSSNNQNFDVLPMFEAVSQFNVTANDDIDVVAFLLARS